MTTDAPAPSSVWRARAFRLAKALTTPLLPEDYVDLFDPLRSPTHLRGRVRELVAETDDARTVVIQPGRGWAGHVPGQYLRIGVDIDGVRMWRAYSITSGPRDDGMVAITVKAITGGAVSTHLVESLHVGQLVQMEQADGEFVLPKVLPEKILLLTGGSGITPVMGILRHAIDQLDDVVLLHSAPRPEDVIFADELRELDDQGRIRLVERHTDTHGMLDTDELERLVPDWRERETWACGPAGMLEMIEKHWAATGTPHLLHTERFRPVTVEPGKGGTVYFTGLERELECDGARPILDQGEEAGILMPSGCRMGICYGCVLPMREGTVRDLRNGEITTAQPGDGVLIQTCINAAAGRCDLDL
ncbi:ferredoxin reductase [Calidifontibacter sp. DB0510]|uniref:Ferredoxin reductase n=1 Tax=Metallococcus carri TaxID=1656884 RepID=A0A967AZS7_9MICO|nr:ferredoxin reductase [Metallococcus carri]NHN56136.1 ferredoxin reductase [Metallococcus carri]NOP37407.1 ferredoxin reductase [Calidifontibacter sp. DB2511S]